MADLIQYYGTGRRKSSIARVFLRPGSGNFTVNKKDVDVYFVTAQQRAAARRSLGIADIGETFDVITTVKGGGVMGQADAVKLGIARALMVFNPELRRRSRPKASLPATRVAKSARSTDRRALALASSSRSDRKSSSAKSFEFFSCFCSCSVKGTASAVPLLLSSAVRL